MIQNPALRVTPITTAAARHRHTQRQCDFRFDLFFVSVFVFPVIKPADKDVSMIRLNTVHR